MKFKKIHMKISPAKWPPFCRGGKWVNTWRPRQNGRHFADVIFKRIFLNENARISIEMSFKFVLRVLINNIPASFQIMAWRRPGDKPLSEPMMVILQTHICVARPQWVNQPCGSPQLCVKYTVCVSVVAGGAESCKHNTRRRLWQLVVLLTAVSSPSRIDLANANYRHLNVFYNVIQ